MIRPHLKTHADPQTYFFFIIIGQSRTLDMSVRYNEPHQTTCHGPPPSGPSLNSCRDLRNRMPYGDEEQTFGPKESLPDISTPFNVYSGKLS